ncbi:unnamed protein product [Caretta caretta]
MPQRCKITVAGYAEAPDKEQHKIWPPGSLARCDEKGGVYQKRLHHPSLQGQVMRQLGAGRCQYHHGRSVFCRERVSGHCVCTSNELNEPQTSVLPPGHPPPPASWGKITTSYSKLPSSSGQHPTICPATGTVGKHSFSVSYLLQAPDTKMPRKAQLSERLLQVTITNTAWPGSVLGEVWTVSVHISLAVQLVSSREGFWIGCFAL